MFVFAIILLVMAMIMTIIKGLGIMLDVKDYGFSITYLPSLLIPLSFDVFLILYCCGV